MNPEFKTKIEKLQTAGYLKVSIEKHDYIPESGRHGKIKVSAKVYKNLVIDEKELVQFGVNWGRGMTDYIYDPETGLLHDSKYSYTHNTCYAAGLDAEAVLNYILSL